MALVKVKRAKTKPSKYRGNNKAGPFNWCVEQYLSDGTIARTFVFDDFNVAIANSVRIANHQTISTIGLVGFQLAPRQPVIKAADKAWYDFDFDEVVEYEDDYYADDDEQVCEDCPGGITCCFNAPEVDDLGPYCEQVMTTTKGVV